MILLLVKKVFWVELLLSPADGTISIEHICGVHLSVKKVQICGIGVPGDHLTDHSSAWT